MMLLVPWSPRAEGQLEVRDPESLLVPKRRATATPEGYSCNLLVLRAPERILEFHCAQADCRPLKM